MLQGDLELAGQAALGPGGDRLAEQVGHHSGTSPQSTDLALVPAPLAPHIGVQGADRPTGQLHRHTQGGPEPGAQQHRRDLLAALAGDVADWHGRPLPERIGTRALRECFLGLFQLLGLLVRSRRPAQHPLGIDHHQADSVGIEQLFHHGHQLQHAGPSPRFKSTSRAPMALASAAGSIRMPSPYTLASR